MLTATPYIVKMFEYIAYDVQQMLGTAVNYMHGHPQEIDQILQAWTKNPVNSAVKYPLIALFQDFDERRGVGSGIMCEISVDLIIATFTEPKLTADERMCRTFIPTLYPIYNQFIDSLIRSGYFLIQHTAKVEHTKTDRMYWGRSNNAVFGDYVDAIHIQGLKLKVKQFNCN